MHLKIGRRASRSILLASAAATHNADQAAVLTQLISNGKNIHETDSDGNTCLHLILLSALPEQPWTVQSLIILIQAGADPSRTNHPGLNALDIACRAPAAFGSFRRDILLQALIEVGVDILDKRLLLPTQLTSSYTSLHHALISGDPHARAQFHFRQALVNRLAFETHRPSIGPRSELYDCSVDRILSSSSQWSTVDPDVLFAHAQLYLQRIIAARKQLKYMIEARISYELWMAISRFVDVRQAQNEALLEFDWFLSVDLEDVFVSQVDCLIQRLEDLIDAHPTSVDDVKHLILGLENAIPKSTLRRISRTSDLFTASVEHPQRPQIVVTVPEQRATSCDSPSLDPPSPRKESMVKTPIEFYITAPDARLAKLPQLNVTCIDAENISSKYPSESPRKESMVKTPIHLYLCQLQTHDALPFTQPRRV